jgi:hypothetical protein
MQSFCFVSRRDCQTDSSRDYVLCYLQRWMKYGVFYIQRSICCFTGKLQRVSTSMSVACLRLELTSRRQALPVRLSFTEQASICLLNADQSSNLQVATSDRTVSRDSIGRQSVISSGYEQTTFVTVCAQQGALIMPCGGVCLYTVYKILSELHCTEVARLIRQRHYSVDYQC